jgi:hypothetical protein
MEGVAGMRLTAVCDLSVCPVSFDFIVWLARAMVARDARGCDALHVVIMPKEDGVGGVARDWGEHDAASARWRLWTIIMAAIPLAGATVTLAANRHQVEEIAGDAEAKNLLWWEKGRAHLAGPLVDMAAAGGRIPLLRATDAARRHVGRWFSDRFVTLTLRDAVDQPERNTVRDTWWQFGQWLRKKYHVVTLEDTRIALDFAGGQWAEVSLDLRLALYERAAMNCIGHNGPMMLCWFSIAPLLQYAFGMPANRWTKHMREHVHLEPDQQPAWFNRNQRLVWKPDTFETMREEFERWEATATPA